MHVHAHDDGHESHAAGDVGAISRRVAWALGLTASLMIVEFIGGWLSGSLALMADAGHMLSDAAALAASWWALRRSVVPATDQRTFGERRSETLAALFNGALLFLVAGGILHEAWERFSEPSQVRAGLMLAVSSIGLLANIAGLLLLHRDRKSSLNLEGAWQHVAGDAAGSLCAVAAAVGILFGGARWAILDPIASAAVSILILIGAYRLLKRTVGVLMEHAPGDIDVRQVRETIATTPGVVGVHCLHVWTISANCRAMSAHVAHAADCTPLELLHRLHERLSHAFRVEHITLQLEPPGFDGCTGHDEWCQIESDGTAAITPK
ncbi:cation diffusion facilitator family transporter [Caulifigura coniformis]|nr:cation diffusion facilitator family transporter [Caulifigura coniformis]